MIDEFIKTIKANLYERSTSPLAGAFIISWCSWNYRILIYLFSNESPQTKIDAIQNILNFKTGFICPLIVSAFFIFVYPYPARFTYWFWRKQKKAMRDIRQKIEGEELLSRDESRAIKKEMDNQQLEHYKEIERKDTDIINLKKLLEQKEADHAVEKERQDKEIEELLKSAEQKHITNPPDHTGETTFEQILSQPIGYDALALYTLFKYPELPISVRIQKLILQDIDSSRYPTLKEIDNAVNQAKKAVDAYKQENPDVFKFGTDYISKSLGFTDSDFALRHAFAKNTLSAFSKYAHLLNTTVKESKPEPPKLEKPDIKVKTTINFVSGPEGAKDMINIAVQNHSPSTVFIRMVDILLKNQNKLVFTTDAVTGEFQQRRELRPGEAFDFRVSPDNIFDRVKPDDIDNVIVSDDIDRVYESDPKQVHWVFTELWKKYKGKT